MSIEVDVLIETYSLIKGHIPHKDRQEAADNLMSVLVDMLSDQDLEEFAQSDNTLGKALKEYASLYDDEESIDDDDC